MIKTLIKKWEDQHAKLLSEYDKYHNLSENEALFLRSEMRQVLNIIEDLKKLAETDAGQLIEQNDKMKKALDVAMIGIEAVLPKFVHTDDEKEVKIYNAFHAIKQAK